VVVDGINPLPASPLGGGDILPGVAVDTLP